MKRLYLAILGAAALLVLSAAGCGVDQPVHPELTPPQLLTRYVAIGNSLTAGFMDAGLIVNGQVDSYPALIARQLDALVSIPPPFDQPLVAAPGIGSTDTGNPAIAAGVLHWDGSEVTLLGTTPIAQVPALLLASQLPRPYDNLGVPGATLLDVTNATSSATSQSHFNPFFDFILRNATQQLPTPFVNTTQLTQAAGRRPALVTLWIGNNDVLGGATSGTPVVGGNITPPAFFLPLYSNLVTSIEDSVMARTGVKPLIVAANIPSVDTVPYFIPKAMFDFIATGDPNGHITTVESNVAYVRLPALAFLQAGGHPPLAADFTLTVAEINTIESTIDAYNSAIAAICQAHGMPLVDVHALLHELETTGIDGVNSQYFLFNGHNAATTAFSLDGIHPNNKGQGVIANAFIDAINAAAGTKMAHVDVASLVWDPTYGQPAGAPGKGAARPSITPEAAAAMDAIFRR